MSTDDSRDDSPDRNQSSSFAVRAPLRYSTPESGQAAQSQSYGHSTVKWLVQLYHYMKNF